MKNIIHKILDLYKHLRLPIKILLIVSILIVLFLAVFLPIFFSDTQKAHRIIKRELSLSYADPQLEIVEFGELDEVELNISYEIETKEVTYLYDYTKRWSNVYPHDDTTFLTDIRKMYCIFRCENEKGVWKFFSTSFLFDDKMELVDLKDVKRSPFEKTDRYYPSDNKNIRAMIDRSYDRIFNEVKNIQEHEYHSWEAVHPERVGNNIYIESLRKFGLNSEKRVEWYNKQIDKYAKRYTAEKYTDRDITMIFNYITMFPIYPKVAEYDIYPLKPSEIDKEIEELLR